MQFFKKAVAALLLSALLSAAAFARAGAAATQVHRQPASVSVTNAWVRANVPGMNVTAAYFDLHNAGKEPATLTGISTSAAASASMHATVIARGISSMRALEIVRLLPGETVKIEPGGMHVMLMGLSSELAAGGRFPLTLSFSDGTQLRVDALIKALATP